MTNEPDSPKSESPADGSAPSDATRLSGAPAGGAQFTEFAKTELRRIESEVETLQARIDAIESDKHVLNLQAESLRMYLGARGDDAEPDFDMVADADMDSESPDKMARQSSSAGRFKRMGASIASRFVEPVANPLRMYSLESINPLRKESIDAKHAASFSRLSGEPPLRQRRPSIDQSDAIADAAYEVLSEMDDQDMHYHDLTDRVRNKIGEFAGNLNSARVQLNSALNADGRFVRPFRRGRYALRKNFPSLRRSVGERLRPGRKGKEDRESGGE